MMQFFSLALSALTLISTAYAQTWTDCNPMNGTCPPNQALGVENYTINFIDNAMSDRVWNTTAGSIKYTEGAGADFTVFAKGDTPTVKTRFYIFFGTVEIIMKAATGQGIVSSIVMQSDDLDEVDWEWIGGNNTHVQSNYFGKGNTTSYDRAIWHPVDDPQGQFHNYTVDWSQDKLDWYIDGNLIRTLPYAKANGGLNFPQTPCDVRLGIWAGGDKDNKQGVIDWAGGLTDYSKSPFTMTVKSVRVRDAQLNATQYVWGDRSGSFGSIQVKTDTTPIKLDGSNSPNAAQSAAQHWNNMSTGAKIAIFACVGGALFIGAAVFAFCCIKQRRAGKHERLIEDAKFEKERSELMAFRSQMSRERSEKLAMGQATPMMGMAGATFQQQPHPPMPNMQRQFSPNGMNGYPAGYAQSHYAQSTVSSNGSGRGYQRY